MMEIDNVVAIGVTFKMSTLREMILMMINKLVEVD